MARTTLTPQTAAPTGAALVYAAGDNVNGNLITGNNNNLTFHVKNTNGAPGNFTVRANGVLVGGQTFPDLVVSIPATTGDRWLGPFDPAYYSQADGSLWVDYANANMTIAMMKTR